MKLKQLLYSLLFIYSSLFSIETSLNNVVEVYDSSFHHESNSCANFSNTLSEGSRSGDSLCSSLSGYVRWELWIIRDISECIETDGNVDLKKHNVIYHKCFFDTDDDMSCPTNQIRNFNLECVDDLDNDGIVDSEYSSPCEHTGSVILIEESKCSDSLTTYTSSGVGTTYTDLHYQSCDNTCRASGVISPTDNNSSFGDIDSDGIPNKCDDSFKVSKSDLYDSYDCDGDGSINRFDSDVDGDGIPNVADNNNSGISDEELSKTCENYQTQASLDCPASSNNLLFSCTTTVKGVSYVTRNECIPRNDSNSTDNNSTNDGNNTNDGSCSNVLTDSQCASEMDVRTAYFDDSSCKCRNGCNPRLDGCKKDEVENTTGGSNCDDVGISNFLECMGTLDAPVGWAEDNAIDYDITLSNDCYLETYDIKLTQNSTKTYEFPPRDFITDLPLEVIASMMIALLYILGLKEFLK